MSPDGSDVGKWLRNAVGTDRAARARVLNEAADLIDRRLVKTMSQYMTERTVAMRYALTTAMTMLRDEAKR